MEVMIAKENAEMVYKSDVLDALKLLISECDLKRKHKEADALLNAHAVIAGISPVEFLDNLNPDAVRGKSKRISSVEPFGVGFSISHAVWRCDLCKSRIDKKDSYCRTCGRKLVDEYE